MRPFFIVIKVEQTEAYKAELENDPRFHGIVFKEDEEEEHAFKKNACTISS